jgi:serine/threonine protein kinase
MNSGPSNSDPSMSPVARELFLQLLDLPRDQRREALVTRGKGIDPVIVAQVARLLDADDIAQQANFMTSPTASMSKTGAVITEGPGSKVGSYKILQLIGEGGFGSVFLAEQHEPVRRRVALKIIKLGMDTRQVIARFEAERQALALMDHPHIARVLDGGATETGRPYFVMEYVIGDSITKFADAHALTVKERLDLFQQVCSAVQHAHTKGIIHRDLKPGNILVSMVDGKPFAKVIDFGIAKATAGGALTDKTLFTEHKQLIGTPEYMSPEQAEGSLDIDTRTDVYSLGVLLYELLTGTTPIDGKKLRSAAFDEMRRMIRDDEPLAPSMKLSRSLDTLASTAAARKIEPGKLSGLVKGELDWIVLRALEKERGRRYETASALAEDVRRHLAGEAVVAAPVSRVYRLSKFVRKNKGPVAAVSAVMLALLAGGSVAAWQWRNAQVAISAKNARDAEVERTLSRVQARLSNGNANARLGWVTRNGSDGKIEFGVELVTTPLAEEEQIARPASSDSGDERLRMLASLAADSVDRLASQRDRAAEGVGKMNSILQGWEGGPLVGRQTDGSTLAERDPLGWAVDNGLMFAEALKQERDKLAAQTAAAKQALSEMFLASTKTTSGMNSGLPAIPEIRGEPGVKLLPALVGDGTEARPHGFEFQKLDTETNQLAPIADDQLIPALADSAKQTLQRALEATEAAEWSAYTANLALAQAAMAANDYPEARRVVEQVPDGKKGWEWRFTHLQAHAVGVCIAGSRERFDVWIDEFGKLAWKPLVSETWVRSYDPRTGLPEELRQQTEGDRERLARATASYVDLFGTPYMTMHDHVLNRAIGPSGAAWRIAGGHGTGLSRYYLVDLNTNQALRWRSTLTAARVGNDQYLTGIRLQDGQDSGNVAVMRIDQFGGPEQYEWSNPQLFTAAILASSPNGPSGLAITTPDGTRRIVGSADKTVRFYEAKDGKPTLPATAETPEGVFREVAVFRLFFAVTHLQMTGDGTRLIIHLEDGSARVWDIRDPEERRKDLQAEWAERVPAGAYLDTLWASDTPDEKLRDAVINDSSLTPLSRLVAAEMLEERLEDDRLAAEAAYASVIKDQTDKQAVLDAAAKLELPKRVNARVMAKVAGWVYAEPEPSQAERLTEETRQRRLAEATLTVERFQSWDTPNYPGDLEDLRRAVATRDELLGEDDAESAKARWMLGVYTFARGKSLDEERDGVSIMRLAASQYRQSAPLSDVTLGMELNLADAEFWVGNAEQARASLQRALASVEADGQATDPKLNLQFSTAEVGGSGFQPRFHGKTLLSLEHSYQYEQSRVHNRERFTDHLRSLLQSSLTDRAVYFGTWIGLASGPEPIHLSGSRDSERLALLVPDDARLYLSLALHRYRTGQIVRSLEAAHQSIARCAAKSPAIDDLGRNRCDPLLQHGVLALIRHSLSSVNEATLAAAGEVDMKADPTLKAPLTADEHRRRAREALAKARALMQPAADGTPSPWANDDDAKALIAEAAALIEK